MLWYLTSPAAFESFIVPWYLTNSGMNRDGFWQRQDQQLTWAIDLWKVQISYEIRGWCCCCGGRMGLPGVGNSTASMAPPISDLRLPLLPPLPSPSTLQNLPVLPGDKSCYCWCCPEDQRGPWSDTQETLCLVEICWCESGLQWYHAACCCNPGNNWLGKFLFQTI